MTRFAPALSIVATLLFATACDAGGSAAGLPEKFEVAWRLEKDGAVLSRGATTCELHKKSPCEFWIDERVLKLGAGLKGSPPRQGYHNYGSFFISLVPPQIRQRNPEWPKGMIALHETGSAFRAFYAVLKEPGVVDAKTATKGEWDPVGHTYMPWSRFAKGFEFDIRLTTHLTVDQNRGVGRIVITVK